MLAALAACGRGSTPAGTAPVPAQPAPGQSADATPSTSFLPTPPLVDAQAPKPRHVSAGQAPLTSNEVTAHDAGGLTGPGSGGAYAIIPGGQDELGWAMYEVPLSDTDRPTGLSVSAQAIIPGGQDELSFWVAAYSFSQQRWEWIGPDDGAPAPWTADGQIAVSLNSPERRARFCNQSDGTDVQSFIAIVAQPESQGGGAGLTVNPGSISFVAQSDPSFVKTEPLPASIPGINVDTANDRIQLFLDNLASEGADGCIVQRWSPATMQWTKLAKLNNIPTNFNDPDDDDAGVPAPVMTQPYGYRCIAFSLDGGTELDAGPSNYQKSHGWATLEIAAGGAAGSLAEVDGCPAVAFHVNGTELHYAISSNALGLSAGDWHGVSFVQDGTSTDFSLKFIAGAPGIAYYDATAKQVGFLRSFNKRGTGTWTNAQVEASTDDLGYYCSLADIGGRPAVAYCDRTTNTLHYNRATTALGNQGDWGTPVVLPAGSTGVGYSACLVALGNGHPAVACYDDGGDQVVFGAATSADGMQAGDWSGQFSPIGSLGISSTPPLSRFISLALVNGNPAVSYWNVGNDSLYFQQAPNADGSGVWSFATVDNVSQVAESNSLAEVPDGLGGLLPAIGYCALPSSVEEPFYCLCGDTNGADGSWGANQVVESNASFGSGGACSLAAIGGRPAMVYDGSTGLMFAVYF
jgi:hypothetical protein